MVQIIQDTRVKHLNKNELNKGDYILYWQQASQRVKFNHALEYAVRKANGLKKPLVVYFGLTDDFPEANERHYYFMLEGLKDVKWQLENLGIKMVILPCSPEDGAVKLSDGACMVVTDRGYLKLQTNWRALVAANISCPLVQVESDAVVPVEEVTNKQEFAARTIRPKITGKLDEYLQPLKQTKPKISSLDLAFNDFDIEDLDPAIRSLDIHRSVKRSAFYSSGPTAAENVLHDFLSRKLDQFSELRNQPGEDFLSNMSPYLHFGQISPIYIALQAKQQGGPGLAGYLEELIVRRELSMNFVNFNHAYDSFESLPAWAKRTLGEHEKDEREYIYTLDELENANTHDPYWNAAQTEMVVTGKMHGYMRMYWGKKILEWSETPAQAYECALYLNNKYELDGRDPNGFTGVAWCFGKHDRPWTERKIFGKVRYMNAKGLERKFDMKKYLLKIETIVD
ncbi:deoxyribodipyrimidine photo-lyase [[Eubacterium] cellulosolvens]